MISLLLTGSYIQLKSWWLQSWYACSYYILRFTVPIWERSNILATWRTPKQKKTHWKNGSGNWTWISQKKEEKKKTTKKCLKNVYHSHQWLKDSSKYFWYFISLLSECQRSTKQWKINVGGDVRKRNSYPLLVELLSWYSHCGISVEKPKTIRINLLYDLAILSFTK